jgi:hypothetical protein
VVLWHQTHASTGVYRAITVSGRLFQNRSTASLHLLSGPQPPLARVWTASLSLATTREIVSFPLGTKMFQFPRFPSRWLCIHQRIRGHTPAWVSPFGHLWLKRVHTPHQSLSQCTASFVGR